MSSRFSGYVRDKHDFYVEPAWCMEALLDSVKLHGPIHDPCCGRGTIPTVASQRGYRASGADLVDHTGVGLYPAQDFLTDQRIYTNIVTNPPYRQAHVIAEQHLCRDKPRCSSPCSSCARSGGTRCSRPALWSRCWCFRAGRQCRRGLCWSNSGRASAAMARLTICGSCSGRRATVACRRRSTGSRLKSFKPAAE
jgi:hypothetical protein